MSNSKDPQQDEDFTTLAYFSDAARAGMVCELLMNNGIEAVLRGANFGALEPLPMVGGFSEIRLIVPTADFNRARELYNAFFVSEEESLKEDENVGNE
jgi:Putative prokaryotic signal transducing protein